MGAGAAPVTRRPLTSAVPEPSACRPGRVCGAHARTFALSHLVSEAQTGEPALDGDELRGRLRERKGIMQPSCLTSLSRIRS